MLRRLLPAALAFVITVAALLPSAFTLPQHGDERMYVWKAAYFWGRVIRLDFSPGTDSFRDPGWDPFSFWAVEQPLGSHALYALALGLTGRPGPSLPYSYVDASLQGPETAIPADTLPVVRVAGVLCAAMGLGLIARRLSWPALVSSALFLAVPQVRDDLARAWAEGPLLLGFGICVTAYGSRLFGPALGLAASLKLTGLALWPLCFLPNACGRWPGVRGVLLAFTTFLLSNPQGWAAGGVPHIGALLQYRYWQFSQQSVEYGASTAGVFLPSRYLWPFELAAMLGLCLITSRIWHRLPPSPSGQPPSTGKVEVSEPENARPSVQ